MREKTPAFSGCDGVCMYALRAAIICSSNKGLDPLTGGLHNSPGEIIGNKYHLVMSHAIAVPVMTNCSIRTN